MSADPQPSVSSVTSARRTSEPSLDQLALDPITPVDRFFVDAPEPPPELDEETHSLEITGMVERPLTLRPGNLPILFPELEITATLIAAGHRGDELDRAEPIEVDRVWGSAAVGTAAWTGVSLRSVLEATSLLDGARWINLRSAAGERWGAALPLEAALSAEVILAYRMNGRTLVAEHGYPLRLIAPGAVEAFSVKWLTGIEVTLERPERVGPRLEAVDGSGFDLREWSVTSVITGPSDGAEVPSGRVEIAGFALAGGRRTVERVDVSTDHGSSWVTARVEPAPVGVWRRWHAELELDAGAHEIVARAWDSSGNTQPESALGLWNRRGVCNNAWHSIRLWAG